MSSTMNNERRGLIILAMANGDLEVKLFSWRRAVGYVRRNG